MNANIRISIKISLKFVPKGSINNIPALVQIMAWRWPGDMPLSEPMMVRLLTHICVTRSQWVNAAALVDSIRITSISKYVITINYSMFYKMHRVILYRVLLWFYHYSLVDPHYVRIRCLPKYQWIILNSVGKMMMVSMTYILVKAWWSWLYTVRL